jgi:hypothetical protein
MQCSFCFDLSILIVDNGDVSIVAQFPFELLIVVARERSYPAVLDLREAWRNVRPCFFGSIVLSIHTQCISIYAFLPDRTVFHSLSIVVQIARYKRPVSIQRHFEDLYLSNVRDTHTSHCLSLHDGSRWAYFFTQFRWGVFHFRAPSLGSRVKEFPHWLSRFYGLILSIVRFLMRISWLNLKLLEYLAIANGNLEMTMLYFTHLTYCN